MSKQPILTPFLDDIDVILYAGDCIEVMRQMPEASVDAIVTDPPYGLEFMGKGWDSFGGNRNPGSKSGSGDKGILPGYGRGGSNADVVRFKMRGAHAFQAFSEAWAVEALRILKPGGHLLAFAGTRTYHRMASGVEDAGFEIRDCIAWMYGSGFPKSLDVSKAIDKAAGAEREVIGSKLGRPGMAKDGSNQRNGFDAAFGGDSSGAMATDITAAATPEATKWKGWGTALKPAFEPIVVARKPLFGTVAANVLEHGTGALNIDACRIGRDPDDVSGWASSGSGSSENRAMSGPNFARDPKPDASGRWPANIALDATAANILDEQSGVAQPKDQRTAIKGGNKGALGAFAGSSPDAVGTWPADPGGGASRFFYTAKASRHDRNAGGLADNTHPTVKPTELMRWLIRLVTPPGGIILDPFGGSGSTGLAARAENTRCILIEREPEYLQIIRDRLSQLNLFTEEN
jgi:site-specific DNA-methyltransferase (adenine-specific)